MEFRITPFPVTVVRIPNTRIRLRFTSYYYDNPTLATKSSTHSPLNEGWK